MALFTEQQQKQVQDAIAQAELNTSGEIRVHIDKRCKEEPMKKAIAVFEKLGMHKTEQRNAVLFYLAMEDKKLAILGDKGINEAVPTNFWDEIRDLMVSHFKKGEFTEGLSKGIVMAGEQLKSAFPYQSDDTNELSNELTFEDGEA
ncbi:MAG: hypothetical protein RI922_2134 [Bacteroidota bacterium]|jgi:uncharacterized membrane protein